MNRQTLVPALTTATLYLTALTPLFAAERELEEVRVTATRTGETLLQQTPIAVTALSGETLRLANIKNIEGMTELLPSVTVSRNTMSGQLYIRGVGTNNVFLGGDPSSTIHQDGVYLSRPISLFNELLDLERVELVRGPQGTLYGRNSTGGTLNLMSKRPSADFNARLSGEVGSFERRRVSAYINGPVKGEAVTANLALLGSRRDGYIDNQHSAGQPDFGDENINSVRTALSLTPSAELSILLRADLFQRDESSPQYKPTLLNVDGSQNARALSDSASLLNDFHSLNIATDSRLDETHSGLSATLNWQINKQLALTSISAYREFDFDAVLDSDFTEVESRISHVGEDQRQLTQEFQLNYKAGALTLVAGVFLFDESSEQNFMAELLDFASPSVAKTRGQLDAQAQAIYADAHWQLSERLTATAGGRLSHEEKEFSQLHFFGPAANPVQTFEGDFEESWSDFSPKLGLSFTVSEDTLLYASLAQGFKSGGFNLVPEGNQFEPEEITSLELGAKLALADGRIRINLASFYYDYSDLQVSQFEVATTGAPRVVITNASDAEIKGLELELVAYPSPRWRLTGALSYLDASYESYNAQRPGANTTDIDVSGNALNSAPKHSVILSSDFEQPLLNGSLNYRLSYHWQDEIFFTPFNDPITRQGAYGLINASLSFETQGKQWELQLYGKNLADKEYTNASQDFSPLGVTLAITEPRTYGLKLSRWF